MHNHRRKPTRPAADLTTAELELAIEDIDAQIRATPRGSRPDGVTWREACLRARRAYSKELSNRRNATKVKEWTIYVRIPAFKTPYVADDVCERLLAVADDALIIGRQGRTVVQFTREASSLEQCIQTALKQLDEAGLSPADVTIPTKYFT